MNKKYFVILAAAILALGFVVASKAYKSQRDEKLGKLAESSESPLLRGYSPSLGPANAKVVLVEFFDPGCETCREFAPEVKKLMAAHPEQIRLVMRYLPLHQGSDTMVKILEAARGQGRYWETLQVMFDTQDHWASHHHPQPQKIWQFLPQAGLDIERIRAEMHDPKILEILVQDGKDAQTLGVRKTPTFFVNGKPLPRFGLRQLLSMVESELDL